jgi:hypothetical protein
MVHYQIKRQQWINNKQCIIMIKIYLMFSIHLIYSEIWFNPAKSNHDISIHTKNFDLLHSVHELILIYAIVSKWFHISNMKELWKKKRIKQFENIYYKNKNTIKKEKLQIKKIDEKQKRWILKEKMEIDSKLWLAKYQNIETLKHRKKKRKQRYSKIRKKKKWK